MEDMLDREQLGFALFRAPRPEQYMRSAYYLTYRMIEQNPGISRSKVKGKLAKSYGLTSCDVESALSALTGGTIFAAVASWMAGDTRCYSVRKEHSLAPWIEHVEETIPAMKKVMSTQPSRAATSCSS